MKTEFSFNFSFGVRTLHMSVECCSWYSTSVPICQQRTVRICIAPTNSKICFQSVLPSLFGVWPRGLAAQPHRAMLFNILSSFHVRSTIASFITISWKCKWVSLLCSNVHALFALRAKWQPINVFVAYAHLQKNENVVPARDGSHNWLVKAPNNMWIWHRNADLICVSFSFTFVLSRASVALWTVE